MPKSAHPGSKKAMAEIWNAEDRDCARRAVAALAYGAKIGTPSPRSPTIWTSCCGLRLPGRALDPPAHHQPESTFATIRNRSEITKGRGSKAAGIAMAFKLIEAAQGRSRAVNGAHLVALVRAGATFKHGKLVERGQRAVKAGAVAA